MAYKKFIKRQGKIYGPYTYKSRREGNKIVTDYVGKDTTKKINFIFWTSVILLFLVFIVMMKVLYPTGRIIMEMPDISYTNTSIIGHVNLDLRAGELLPDDSIVKLKLNGQEKQIPISELLSQSKENGNFFIENQNLQGSGEGYGIPGAKKIYPVVYFRLKIDTYEKEKEPVYGISENIPTSEQPAETPVEPANEPASTVDQPAESAEEQTPVEPTPTEEQPAEQSQQESKGQQVSITGQAISTEFIDGSVTGLQSFSYNLESNQEASLVSGSVRNDSNDLADDTISLSTSGGQAVVSTDYYLEEQGFGQDYLGEQTVELAIDVSNFNIIPEEGTLQVSIAYGDAKIVEGEKIISLTGEEVPEPEPTPEPTPTPAPEENTSKGGAGGAENVSVLSQIKPIEDISININSNYSINLSGYFIGVAGYNITELENITEIIDNEVLTLVPDANFTGTRTGKVTAFSASSLVESNEFTIYVQGKQALMQIQSTPGDISACQVLDTQGVYDLTQDLLSNGNCFNITIGNVTLDCHSRKITGNGSGSGVLSRIYAGRNLTIKNCIITNFSSGIRLDGIVYSQIQGNSIYNSSYGILLPRTTWGSTIPQGNLMLGSKENNITNNQFINNTINAFDDCREGWTLEGLNPCWNYWNLTSNCASGKNIIGGNCLGGNYWDDYSGTDINIDGIGETNLPYNASNNISIGGDFLPLVNPCGTSITQNITMTTDMNCSGTGLSFGAEYIYLDCAGHSIIGNGSGQGVEAMVTARNISIKNCNISNFDICILLSAINSTINNNTVSNCKRGVDIYGGTNNWITNNNFFNNYGETVSIRAGSNFVYNNKIINNSQGVYLATDYNTVNNNTIENSSYYSVWLGSSHNKILNNVINNATSYGIYFSSTSLVNMTIINNTITKSGVGIKIYGSNGSRIYNNKFNNTINAQDDYGYNSWNTTKTSGTNIIGGSFLGGNWWSDYTGVDSDSDGLGNTKLPYNASSNILHGGDLLPLTTNVAGEGYTVVEISACRPLNVSNTYYNLTASTAGASSNSNLNNLTCFNVTADNVTLDCNSWSNRIIYGNRSSATAYYGVYSSKQNTQIQNCEITKGNLAVAANVRYGIYFTTAANGSIENVNASNNRFGIYLTLSNNNTIYSSLISNNTLQGLYINGSVGNSVTNTTINKNGDTGIVVDGGSGNNLLNNTAINNTIYGILVTASSGNILAYNILQENQAADVYVSAASDAHCNNVIQNNTGSANKSILYYNESAILSNNNTISELILCNADYSSIDNVTVSGSDTLYNNGVWILRTDYTNITNTNSSNNQIGFNVTLGNYNTLAGNTANNNSLYGLYLEKGHYSVLYNNTANNNTYGIYLYYSNHTQLTGNNISTNTYGIRVLYGQNNTLLSNQLYKNKDYGIWLYNSDNNNLTLNTVNSTTGGGLNDRGITLESSNYNIVNNNTASNNSDYGIVLDTSHWNNITFNTVNSNGVSGIYTTAQPRNNTFLGNTANNNSWHGIDIGCVNTVPRYNNDVINNTANGNGMNGISYAGTCTDGEIKWNTFNYNGQNGISATPGSTQISKLNISHNTANHNKGSGLFLSDLMNNNTIYNNTFINNSNAGIYLDYQNNPNQFNNISSNFIYNNTYGIVLDYNYKNTISDNVIQENANWDLFVELSAPGTIDSICNNTILNNLGSGGRPILFFNTTDSVNLQNNDAVSELILCNADNSIVNNVTVKGSDILNNNGILVVRANYTTISNSSSLGNYYGLYIYRSPDNNFTNIAINNSRADAIYIENLASGGNILQNISVIGTNSSMYDIRFATSGIQRTQIINTALANYTFTNLGNITFKDTGEGEIRFIGLITATGNNLSADISIGNNSVAVDSAAKTGLNKPANITLYNIRTDFTSPIVLRNGLTCPSNACYNFTNLSAGTVVFNVTGWTNYSIGEFYTSLNITGCQSLDEANKIYVLTQSVVSTTTCFNVTANNVTLDCINWSNKINYGNVSSTTLYHGVFSNQNYTTVKNCEIRRGNLALTTNPRYGVTFLISNNGAILNSNISHNRIGIYFNATLNSSIFNNTFTNNSAFGIYLNRSTTNNTIYNNFFNNSGTINAYANGSNNWNVTYNCTGAKNIIGGNCTGGNWWSNYAGLDDGFGVYPHNNSNDGIGDTLLPYNASNNITVPGTGDWLPLVYPIPTAVILNSPSDNNITNSNMIVFNCSVTGFADLVNISLLTNISGTWQIDVTKPATGPSATAIFVLDRIPVGTYDWNCIAAGASGTITADSNRTFTINQTARAMVTKANATGNYYRIWDNGTWKPEIKTSAALNEQPSYSPQTFGPNGGYSAYIEPNPYKYNRALAGACAFNGTNWTCGGNYVSSKQAFNSWGYGISSGSYLFNGSNWTVPDSAEGFPSYIEGIDSYGKKVAVLYQKGKNYNPALTLKIWNGYDYSVASVLDYEATIVRPSSSSGETAGYYRGLAGDLRYLSDGKLMVVYTNPNNNVSIVIIGNNTYSITKKAPTHIPVAVNETVRKIKLAGNTTSTMLGSYGNSFYMEIWNGSAWSDFNLLDANTKLNNQSFGGYGGYYNSNPNSFDIAFNKNKALIAWVDNVTGSNVVKYRFWDGSLQAEQTLAVSDKPRIVQVAGNSNGNEFILTAILNDSNTAYFVYDGSSWDAGLNAGKVSFRPEQTGSVIYSNLPVAFINNLDTNLEPAVKLDAPDFKTMFDKTNISNVTFNCEVWDDAGIDNISIYSNLYGLAGWDIVYNISVNGAKYYNLSFSADALTVPVGLYSWNCKAVDIGGKESEAGVNKTFSISNPIFNLSNCYQGENYGGSSGLPNESFALVGVEVGDIWTDKSPDWVHACQLLGISVNISQGKKAFAYYGWSSRLSVNQVLVGVDGVHWITDPLHFNVGWATEWAQSAKLDIGIVNNRNCYKSGDSYGYTLNFNELRPYYAVVGSDLGHANPIVARRNDWVQVCEIATYELISVQLLEPDDDSMTMDDPIQFSCDIDSAKNNLSNVSLYIRELDSEPQATITVPVGQREATEYFNVSSIPKGIYHWNCLATDETGKTAWAPKDYEFTRDCIVPADDTQVDSDILLCNGTYYVNDINNDGIFKVSGNDIKISVFNATTIISSSSNGRLFNITDSGSIIVNGSVAGSNMLNITNFTQVAGVSGSSDVYLFGLNIGGYIAATDLISVESSSNVLLDNSNLNFDTPEYSPGNPVVRFSNSNGTGVTNCNISLSTETDGSYTALSSFSSSSYVINTIVAGNGWSYSSPTPSKAINGFTAVYGNRVYGFDYGIVSSSSDPADIEQNNVTSCNFGIVPSSNDRVINNSFADNYIALWIIQSSNTTITWNKFTRSTFDVLMNEPGSPTDITANNNTLSNGYGFDYTSDLNDTVVGDGLGMFGCINCYNLTVQNINSANTSFAVYIEGDQIRFKNITGTGLLNGLWVKGASNVSIENVSLINGTNIYQPPADLVPYNNPYATPDAYGIAIYLYNSDKNAASTFNIKNLLMHGVPGIGFYYGLVVFGGTSLSNDLYSATLNVKNSTFVTNGINSNAATNDISESNVTSTGITIEKGTGTINNNIFNASSISVGGGGTIDSNNFYSNGGSLTLSTMPATFKNNLINNFGGLFTINTPGTNSSIYNNLFNTSVTVYTSGGSDTNNWNITKTAGTNVIGGSWLGGNYWRNYTGTDTDADGIGNTLLPYNSTYIKNNGDYLPLVYPAGPDTTLPNVTLISPANNTLNTTSNTILFIYNVSDASGIANCSLIINNAVNLTNSSIVNGLANNFTQTLANGNYNWSVNCTDNSANYNIGASDIYNLSINVGAADTAAPLLSIVYPENTTYYSNVTHLNYTVNDINLQACWYSLNNGQNNVTITCGNNVTGLNAGDGSHTWTVWANDSLGSKNMSRVTFSVNTTAVPFNLTVISPQAIRYASTSIDFIVSTSTDASSCWFNLDSAGNTLMASVNSTWFNNTLAFARDTIYTVNFTCNSTSNAFAYSEYITFIIEAEPGCTPRWVCTNWTNCSDGLQNRTCIDEHECHRGIGMPSNCKLETGSLNDRCTELKPCAENCTEISKVYSNWSSCVNGTQTRIINHTYYCGTLFYSNESEETFSCEVRDLDVYYEPLMLDLIVPHNSTIDFYIEAQDNSNLAQPEVINVKWYLNGNLTKEDAKLQSIISELTHGFNSEYDLTVQVSTSYQTVNVPWHITTIDSNCSEQWACNWTECINKDYKFPFSCLEENACGTNLHYPRRAKCYCKIMPNCTAWEECKADYNYEDVIKGNYLFQGFQFRNCNDSNRCLKHQFKEWRLCNLTTPLTVKPAEKCGEKYLELYDEKANKLVAKVRETILANKTKVFIAFTQAVSTQYCSYCYDGIKDYDETGIDCGGSCPPCSPFKDWLWIIRIIVGLGAAYAIGRLGPQIWPSKLRHKWVKTKPDDELDGMSVVPKVDKSERLN